MNYILYIYSAVRVKWFVWANIWNAKVWRHLSDKNRKKNTFFNQYSSLYSQFKVRELLANNGCILCVDCWRMCFPFFIRECFERVTMYWILTWSLTLFLDGMNTWLVETSLKASLKVSLCCTRSVNRWRSFSFKSNTFVCHICCFSSGLLAERNAFAKETMFCSFFFWITSFFSSSIIFVLPDKEVQRSTFIRVPSFVLIMTMYSSPISRSDVSPSLFVLNFKTCRSVLKTSIITKIAGEL